MKSILCSILFFFLVCAHTLAAETLVIDTPQDEYELAGRISYTIDKASEYTIDRIIREKITSFDVEKSASVIRLGVLDAELWIAITVLNQTGEDLQLSLNQSFPLISSQDFYHVHEGLLMATYNRTKGKPFFINKQRLLISHFPFELKPGVNHLYLRAKTNTSYTLYLSLTSMDKEMTLLNAFHRRTGLFTGIMLTMVFINFLFALAFRDKSYSYLTFLALFSMLFIAEYAGYDYYLSFISLPGKEYYLLLFYITLTGFFNILLAESFLGISKKVHPRTSFAFLLIKYVLLLNIVLALFIPYRVTSIVLGQLMIIIALTLLYTSFKKLLTKKIDYLIYFISYFILFLSALFIPAGQLGLFPFSINIGVVLTISVLIQIFVLQASTALRIVRIHKERTTLQQRLIENTQKMINEQKSLAESYRRFVPQEFLSLIKKKDFREIQAGDNAKQQLSILFTDIENFSHYANTLNTNELIKFINIYNRHMIDIISHRAGFIDKYIGDAIMALFIGKTSDMALQSVVQILETETELQKELQESFPDLPPVRTRIGLNTGFVVVGMVGSNKRLSATVLSTAVNLASRLEALNKTFNTQCLLSEGTYNLLSNKSEYSIRKLPAVSIKGMRAARSVYELFELNPPHVKDQKLKTLSDFEEAVSLYDSGNIEASAALFRKCATIAKEDKTLRAILKKMP